MKEYKMIWSLNNGHVHERSVSIEEISEICAYGYGASIGGIFPEIVGNMKKGQTVSHTFRNGDKITITALEDISVPF